MLQIKKLASGDFNNMNKGTKEIYCEDGWMDGEIGRYRYRYRHRYRNVYVYGVNHICNRRAHNDNNYKLPFKLLLIGHLCNKNT